ncbi:MAG: prepilin-type N-terminal cleavage/methylation domain-containing protein [Opitutaceae bacterium]|jgi:prepilin-type N-terminal cleavage/methylation domain-containing protein/prepilin-type processing-associated H-X9-DG protein
MNPKRAFTLVELLAVLAIVGILAVIIIPVTASVRANAKTSTCASSLRQLGVAGLLYAQDHQGRFSTSRLYNPSNHPTEPGVVDYVVSNYSSYANSTNKVYADSINNSSVFTCPSLSDYAFSSALQGLRQTYSASLTATNNTAGGTVALRYVKAVVNPSKTAWIMDGAWESGSGWFASVIGYNQLTTYLPKLQNPHGGKENVLFVDGHVALITPSQMQDATSPFWTGL